ncbi:MAG: prepilin-type N-terminal cleavage/methylation domain-containing protein [Candidatus Omnitrophica bacterium]|nr:prepilin-type N-terminal cleavage/methylation domain-containing protein [Candidatus Omnitrophota bacterium]
MFRMQVRIQRPSEVESRGMLEKCGFSLLEVLITIIILTVGVIAITNAFSSGLLSSADIENVDLALNIAQAKMEEIKDAGYASLADSGPTSDPNFPNFNVSVNVAEGNNPMQVDVAVDWNVKGGQTGITLMTLIADYATQ